MSRRGERGFSLIEMTVAMGLGAAAVAGISLIVLAQSNIFIVQQQRRDLEAVGRHALNDIARSVRMAGYGIAPSAAFDFDRFACTTPGDGSTCNGGSRDRSDAPDELVVAFRDPVFSRRVTAKTGSGPYTLTIATALTARLEAGRLVLLVCDGADPVSYGAINTSVDPGSTSVQVRTVAAADGPFPTAAPADACFAASTMMLVERIRYFIADDVGLPSLFKDRGRGTNELIARGIEDLQFTFTIGAPPAGSPFAATVAPFSCSGTPQWTYGDCATASGTPNPSATAPDWQNANYDSANRYTGHPANIRRVQIELVALATRDSPERAGDGAPILGNRPARARDKRHRTVFSVGEPTPNLLTRGYFLPPILADTNVGGG